MVVMEDIPLPEFDRSHRIHQQRALVFDNDSCKYYTILGTNFLTPCGIHLNYETGTMERFDSTLAMRPSRGLTSLEFDTME